MNRKTKKKPRAASRKRSGTKPASRHQPRVKTLTKPILAQKTGITNNPDGRPQEGGIKQPAFDSMQACSGMTGIPIDLLKLSKDKGCAAHRHGRVYLFDFIRWYFEQERDELSNWPSIYEEFRAKRERQRFEREGDLLIEAKVVEAGLAIAVQAFMAEMDRIVRDMPAVLKGMAPEQSRAELAKHMLTIKPRIEAAFAEVGKGDATTV